MGSVCSYRAFLQSDIPDDYQIDFYYAYNNENEGAYADEFASMKTKENVRLHLIDSSKVGFLQQETFEDTLSKETVYDMFFCGPLAMRKKVVSDLKAANYKLKEIHFEVFKFK